MPRPTAASNDPCGRPAAAASDPCGRPAPKIRVIVPPPDIVVRPCCAEKKCWHLLGHKKQAEECAPACAESACAGTGPGTISFNMQFAMPLPGLGAFGDPRLALLGMNPALAGMLGNGNPQAAPLLGLAGLGGGAGANASLAALLGAGNGPAAAPTGLEAQMMRALLARANAASAPPAANDALEARLRVLNAQILALTNAEIAKVRQDVYADLLGTLQKGDSQMQELKKRIEELEKRPQTNK
jgi:hypothetical protein